MKKVFTFHGADHKCGCSMISQCVAERIAQENSKLSVLLVHAEQSEGAGYSPHVRESMERITRIRKRDELMSDIIYFPVVIDCMVVLLNFLYVAYFLQQKELMELFF